MAAQWPQVKAWLVRTIPTLPGMTGVSVYSGPPESGEQPERYVTVGYVTDDHGGSYQLAQSPDGFQWDEAGEVRSEVVAQVGDSDPAIAQGEAFVIADALDRVIRSDHTLGKTLSANGTAETHVEVHSISNAGGTATALVHTLRYTTTTL